MKIILFALLTGIILSGCTQKPKPSPNSKIKATYHTHPAPKEVTVMELFTSEGCSSCPPVQKEFNRFIEKYQDDPSVICLMEHVDYWNNLVWGEGDCRGYWVDEYASGFYTDRQFAYAKKLDTIPATPELFINGVEMVASPDFDSCEAMLKKHQVKQAFDIQLTLNEYVMDSNKALLVDFKTMIDTSYQTKKPFWPSLIVFLVKEHAEKTPDRAENCGTLLVGRNIALTMASATLRKSNHGTLALRVPEGTDLTSCKIMAIVQNLYSLDIIGGTTGFELAAAE